MQIAQSEGDNALYLKHQLSLPLEKLVFDVPGVIYVIYARAPGSSPIGMILIFLTLYFFI